MRKQYMFCETCGFQMSATAKFCPSCGTASGGVATASDGSAATGGVATASGGYAAYGDSGNNRDNLIGWSPHIENPIFRNEADAYNRRMIIMGIIAFFAFTIALGAYGYFGNNGEVFFPLLGLGIVIGFFSMMRCFRIAWKRKASPTWDGVVEAKRAVKTRRKKYDSTDLEGDRYEWQEYMRYEVVIRKESGKHCILSENDSTFIFDNYAVGDRVRHHGFMGYMEKYDKRNCKYILCAKCGNDNSPHLDNCDHCDSPLPKGSGQAGEFAPPPNDPNAHITHVGSHQPPGSRPKRGSDRLKRFVWFVIIIFALFVVGFIVFIFSELFG